MPDKQVTGVELADAAIPCRRWSNTACRGGWRGLDEVGCAILSGGLSAAFKVKSLGEAAIQVIGDGGKTAKYEDHQIGDNLLVFDTVKQSWRR